MILPNWAGGLVILCSLYIVWLIIYLQGKLQEKDDMIQCLRDELKDKKRNK